MSSHEKDDSKAYMKDKESKYVIGANRGPLAATLGDKGMKGHRKDLILLPIALTPSQKARLRGPHT